MTLFVSKTCEKEKKTKQNLVNAEMNRKLQRKMVANRIKKIKQGGNFADYDHKERQRQARIDRKRRLRNRRGRGRGRGRGIYIYIYIIIKGLL